MCRHSVQLSGVCEAKVNYQEDVLSFLPNCSLVICMKVPKLTRAPKAQQELGEVPANVFFSWTLRSSIQNQAGVMTEQARTPGVLGFLASHCLISISDSGRILPGQVAKLSQESPSADSHRALFSDRISSRGRNEFSGISLISLTP